MVIEDGLYFGCATSLILEGYFELGGGTADAFEWKQKAVLTCDGRCTSNQHLPLNFKLFVDSIFCRFHMLMVW